MLPRLLEEVSGEGSPGKKDFLLIMHQGLRAWGCLYSVGGPRGVYTHVLKSHLPYIGYSLFHGNLVSATSKTSFGLSVHTQDHIQNQSPSTRLLH